MVLKEIHWGGVDEVQSDLRQEQSLTQVNAHRTFEELLPPQEVFCSMESANV